MDWIDTTYLTPEGGKVDIRLNTAHIRAVKRKSDGKAMVLSAVPNVGALTLNISYDNFLKSIDHLDGGDR